MNKFVKWGAVLIASAVISATTIESVATFVGTDATIEAKNKKQKRMTYKAYAKYLQKNMADSKVRWSSKAEAMVILPTRDNADLFSEYADTYMTDGELDNDALADWNSYTAFVREQAEKAEKLTKSKEAIEIIILNPLSSDMALYDYDAFNEETYTDAFNGIGNDYTD